MPTNLRACFNIWACVTFAFYHRLFQVLTSGHVLHLLNDVPKAKTEVTAMCTIIIK